MSRRRSAWHQVEPGHWRHLVRFLVPPATTYELEAKREGYVRWRASVDGVDLGTHPLLKCAKEMARSYAANRHAERTAELHLRGGSR